MSTDQNKSHSLEQDIVAHREKDGNDYRLFLRLVTLLTDSS